jgi:uncharacterized protein YggE
MTTDERPPAARLSVRGEATIEVSPEIVELAIAVSARDPKRERALELLSRRNDECLALVKGYGEAVEKVETSGLIVYPEIRYKARKEQVRSYRGSVRLEVTIVDFAIAGELVARLSDGDMTTVSGPWWRLRPDSPVHRRVRQEAARDAVVRAREYAEAVGARLTSLVELADEGLTTQAVAPHVRGGPAFAGSVGPGEGAAYEPPPIDLEPQLQTVHARVEARFTISQPDHL